MKHSIQSEAKALQSPRDGRSEVPFLSSGRKARIHTQPPPACLPFLLGRTSHFLLPSPQGPSFLPHTMCLHSLL